MKHVKWEEVDLFIEELSKKIPSITGVFGVPRGGLCLAVMLSYKLGVPLLQAPYRGCLIIDDIADTGVTLKPYRGKGYYIATMYYHKQSQVVPDFWYKEKTDEWIVYPWEIGDE